MTACTEKEAAEKWCPHYRGTMARVGDVALVECNDGARCIGSRCMQWRWHDSETAYYTPAVDVPKGVNHEEATKLIMGHEDVIRFTALGWQPSDMGACPPLLSPTGTWSITLSKSRGEDRRGYCGLAGQP